MKKLGLIGGTSWRSTVEYYSRINTAINAINDDNTNPRINLASLNQRQIHDHQRDNNWQAIADLFTTTALELQSTGVDGIALCANTPHKVYQEIQTTLNIPILHIADAIAATAKKNQWHTLGLIGTRFTMSEPFLRDHLHSKNLTITVPDEPTQLQFQDQIYDKLSVGNFDQQATQFALTAIETLAQTGTDAVILGCTEFPLLLQSTKTSIPLIDTIQSHCDYLIDFITSDQPI